VKRKFEEVEVKTGEEEETNVLQISCKLHTFDKAKGSWAERGRGQLRLNDKVEVLLHKYGQKASKSFIFPEPCSPVQSNNAYSRKSQGSVKHKGQLQIG
jgi:RanBP1 domain